MLYYTGEPYKETYGEQNKPENLLIKKYSLVTQYTGIILILVL